MRSARDGLFELEDIGLMDNRSVLLGTKSTIPLVQAENVDRGILPGNAAAPLSSDAVLFHPASLRTVELPKSRREKVPWAESQIHGI